MVTTDKSFLPIATILHLSLKVIVAPRARLVQYGGTRTTPD
jgi:hypothetical protein